MQENVNQEIQKQLREAQRELRQLRAELEALRAGRTTEPVPRFGPISALDWMAVY